MRLQMIDRDQRRVVHQRDGFRRGETDDDAADQSGTGRRGDAAEVAESDAGFFHRGADNPVEHVDMGARSDLGHDAAERRMLVNLRAHDVGQNPPRPVAQPLDHGGGGFVAGGLDPQYQRRLACQFQSLRSSPIRRFP